MVAAMRKGDGMVEVEVTENIMSAKSVTEITVNTSNNGMTFFFSTIFLWAAVFCLNDFLSRFLDLIQKLTTNFLTDVAIYIGGNRQVDFSIWFRGGHRLL